MHHEGFIEARAGDIDGARSVIKEIESRWLGATNLNDIAFVYHAIGDLDSYFTYINRAIDQHTVRYLYVIYCPLLAKGRDDPRYHIVMQKMKELYEKRKVLFDHWSSGHEAGRKIQSFSC